MTNQLLQKPESISSPVFAFLNKEGGVPTVGVPPFPFFYTPEKPHQFRIIWHNPFDYHAASEGILMGVVHE